MSNQESFNILNYGKYHGLLPFLLGQTIPVEEAYKKLLPFDEKNYIDGIGEFIVSHKLENKKYRRNYPRNMEKVREEYIRNGAVFVSLISLLKDFHEKGFFIPKILRPKPEEISFPQYGPKLPEESYWSISDSLEFLYSLGCPQLYMFHKTAHLSQLHNSSVEEPFLSNPLIHTEVFVTDKVRIPLKFLNRPKEELQYMIAFPMKELSTALFDKKIFDPLYNLYFGTVGYLYLQVDVLKINFNSLNPDEMETILKKTQVFLPKIVNKLS